MKGKDINTPLGFPQMARGGCPASPGGDCVKLVLRVGGFVRSMPVCTRAARRVLV